MESAIQAEDGQVYAVEINPEELALFEENARKFAVSNIKVIEGSAPEILKDLPAPDCCYLSEEVKDGWKRFWSLSGKRIHRQEWY